MTQVRYPLIELEQLESGSSVNSDQLAELGKLVDYFLSKKNWPSRLKVAVKEFVLGFITLAGGIPYIFPTLDYVDRHYGDDIFMKASFLAGTCLPAMLVFYMATEIFFDMRTAQYVPPDLENILARVNTPTQQFIEDAQVTCGSAISSVPITAVTLMYPIPGTSVFLTYTLASITAVINTLLHFLPIKLIINDTKLMYRGIKNSHLTPEEKKVLRREEKKAAIYQELKGRFLSRLTGAQKRITIQGFTGILSEVEYKIDHNYLPPADVITSLSHAGTMRESSSRVGAMIGSLCEYGASFVSAAPANNNWILKAVAGAGAVLVVTACSGYSLATYNQFVSRAGVVWGSVFAALPIAALNRLLWFFGNGGATSNYNYWTLWGEHEVKIPLEFKLYPKTASLLMLLSVYLSVFSYAAAEELIETSSSLADEKWDILRSFLVWFARLGVPYVTLNVMFDFWQTTIKKLVRNFGNDEGAMILCLIATIDQLKLRFSMMKNEKFIAVLDKLSDDKLQILLGMTREEFDEKHDKLKKLERKAAAKEEVELEEMDSSAARLLKSEEDNQANKKTKSSLRGWFSQFNFCPNTRDKEPTTPSTIPKTPSYGAFGASGR